MHELRSGKERRIFKLKNHVMVAHCWIFIFFISSFVSSLFSILSILNSLSLFFGSFLLISLSQTHNLTVVNRLLKEPLEESIKLSVLSHSDPEPGHLSLLPQSPYRGT